MNFHHLPLHTEIRERFFQMLGITQQIFFLGRNGLSITDGQHRRLALEEVLQDMTPEEAGRFQQDGVAIMVTCEAETEQVHQDFADCSKTKPLPKSISESVLREGEPIGAPAPPPAGAKV